MPFCVKCGAEGPTYRSLCKRCFLEGKSFTTLPDHVNLFQCKHCEDYLMEGKWVSEDSRERAAERAAEAAVVVTEGAEVQKIGLHAESIDETNYKVDMTVELEVEGLPVYEDRSTIVRFKSTSCPRCNKLMGSYYEATLQVRTRDRRMPEDLREEIIDRIQRLVDEHRKSDRELFISRIDRLTTVHGGADVLLSSSVLGRTISRNLADQYAAEVKETATLVTQKQGKELYRVTFLVKLPAYRFGDIVRYGKRLFLVGALRANSTKLTDLRTAQSVMFSNSDMTSAKVIGRKEDLLEAVVVNEMEKEVQVMHPVTFKIFELRKPPKFERKGDTVKVFQYDDELFLLPLQG